jgi:hypothetical protein
MHNEIIGYMLDGDNPVPIYSQDTRASDRFARWLRDPKRRQIAHTVVRPGLAVTTSFLGINQARYPVRDLVLWETRVTRDGRPESTHHYTSATAARTGHWEIVSDMFRAACLPIPPAIREVISANVPAAYQ